MAVFSVPFHLNENPFGETPDTRFFYNSKSHEEALRNLVMGIAQGKGFALLTGTIGTGKTLLCRVLLKSLQGKVNTALILHPFLSQLELLTAISEEFALPEIQEVTVKNLLDQLNDYLVEQASLGKRSLLVIDDAQRLSHEALETIRLLSNLETETDKLLQIVLVGQPELRELLEEDDLAQLEQRISTHVTLEPLSQLDTDRYIRHRIHLAGGSNFLRFQPKALAEIHKASKGIPRLINKYCEAIVLEAQEKRLHLIDARFAKSVIKANFEGTSPFKNILAFLQRRGNAASL